MANKKRLKKAAAKPTVALVIKGDWKDAMKTALAKKPPEAGLPQREAKRRRKRSKKTTPEYN